MPGHHAHRHADGGVEADLLGGQAPVGEPERPERDLHAGGHEEDHVDGAGVQRRDGSAGGFARGSESEVGEGKVADRIARPDRAGSVLQFHEAAGPGKPGNAPGAFGGEDLDGARGVEAGAEVFAAAGVLGLGEGGREGEAARDVPGGAGEAEERRAGEDQGADEGGDRVAGQAEDRAAVPSGRWRAAGRA